MGIRSTGRPSGRARYAAGHNAQGPEGLGPPPSAQDLSHANDTGPQSRPRGRRFGPWREASTGTSRGAFTTRAPDEAAARQGPPPRGPAGELPTTRRREIGPDEI